MNDLGPMPAQVLGFFAGILGFGGVLGFLSGYATIKLVKMTAFFLGAVFLLIQALVFSDIISVNWQFLNEICGPLFSEQGVHRWTAFLYRILTVNLPFAGAFITGFWLGVKKG